jgi:aminopeptidase-like protein
MVNNHLTSGDTLYKWAEELFPICRSITGDGVRKSLQYLCEKIGALEIFSVPSGERVFDWNVPQEWNIVGGYVDYENGERIIDFKEHNLHVVGYSEPVDKIVSYEELNKHLHSLPDQPNAIPYVTSYYKPYWGFCISEEKRKLLDPHKKYHVCIDSSLKKGSLNYGELIIPGCQSEEVFLSSYICHPSMANNELSGPIVLAALCKYLLARKNRYTYRIAFIPETIGSITYLSRNLPELKDKVIAGFNITCVGDERCYSYLPTKYGNTVADKALKHVLNWATKGSFIEYSWLDRGSDERQYCSPGVDLPIASFMRSKYGTYPEYHTSLDDLSFISSQGLYGSQELMASVLGLIDSNTIYVATQLCEPNLGKRGLYEQISKKNSVKSDSRTLLNILSYADGTNSVLDISEYLGMYFFDVLEMCSILESNELLVKG